MGRIDAQTETVSEASLANLKPWKPGQSGNPGGKPAGARNGLTTKFLNQLLKDFEADGAKAIKNCREQQPAKYVQIIASLMPKQIEASQPLEDLEDAELAAAIALLRGQLASRAGKGAGEAAQQASVN